jgi:peroxiredoxin Q/BCP
LYFYPADDTPGCTTEACVLRDNLPRFTASDLVILGVSADSVASHTKFAQKYGLSFTLLADTTTEMQRQYGVWQPKKLFGKEFLGTIRTSYLIDPQGKIAKVYPKVKPATHAVEVLTDLANLQ